MRDQIADEMRRANPRIEIGDISTRDGKISFMVRDVTHTNMSTKASLVRISSTRVAALRTDSRFFRSTDSRHIRLGG